MWGHRARRTRKRARSAPERVALTALLALVAACAPAPRAGPPDLLLVVVDTLRADAVSAYGVVSNTTPHLDGLAARGLRYSQARADASWTLPSHASLLSGLVPPHHDVGTRRSMAAPESLVTLAERLGAQGYQTAGFSENPVVGPAFGLDQGFDHFEARSIASVSADAPFPVRALIDRWLSRRDPERPFFVFVNLMDAHDPFLLRATNPHLPPGVDRDAAEASLRRHRFGICDALPPRDHIRILHGLYLGDVEAADSKLARLHATLERASGGRLITVVTSDHGEHFGERRLLDHQFSVAEALLHVPLVVHGLPDQRPGVVESPVSGVDVAASILAWAGVPAGAALDGRPLPMPGEPPDEAPRFGFYADWRGVEPAGWPEDVPPLWSPDDREGGNVRAACGPGDRVFGDLAAVVLGGFKLIANAGHPSELYDLRWDPTERSDLARQQPERVAALEAELEALRAAPDTRTAVELDPGAREALRALGYLD